MSKFLRNFLMTMGMLLLPVFSVLASDYNKNFFSGAHLNNIDYYFKDGRAIIRSIDWLWLPLHPYPCVSAMERMGLDPALFDRCVLSRHIWGWSEEVVYTDMKALTNQAMRDFFYRTGDVGPGGDDSQFWYGLEFIGRGGFHFSRLPIPSEIPPLPGPPEPELSCSLSSGNINYGTLAESEIEGKKATANVYIYCNKQANVKLVANQYNSSTGIAMGSTALSATVTIGGTSAATGKRLTVYASNSTPVLIEATLRKRQATIPGGTYQGSLVLTLNTD